MLTCIGMVERKRNENAKVFFCTTPPTTINHCNPFTDHMTNSKSSLRKFSKLEHSQKK